MPVAERYVKLVLPLKLPILFTYSVPQEMEDVTVGCWVYAPVAAHTYLGVVAQVFEGGSPDDVDVARVRDIKSKADFPPVSEQQIRFWHSVADYYMCSVGEVFKSAYPLAFRKQVEVRSRKKDEKPAEVDFSRLPELSDAQRKAFDRIEDHFAQKRTVLLEGVTGSGKTEIYMHLARPHVEAGRSVLYLVPEIALSRQLEDRLRNVFGDSLLVFHSRQTAPQRKLVYQKLAAGGRPYVVLGTRSAVFLPLNDIGLVIIDEEHDSSYKQTEPAPRYNGRDAAVMLASQCGSQVVLGSATPSYESLLNCSGGRYAHVELPVRFHRGADTEVAIIDMGEVRRLHNSRGSFSVKLLNAIRKTVERGEQVMVFRSRRAYAPVVQCTECGYIPKCPKCNVSLSYHKHNNSLECHYCGYHAPFSRRCPQCGEYSLSLRGTGTERIEEELSQIFPQFRIARFDAETAASKTREQAILKDFASGKTDILVGTQMITKGFDFEKLSLVAVLSADSLFAVQDFRADERAFQLLQQLRGRAGRRQTRGMMMIQTEQPDHPVFARLLDEGTVAERLMERKMFVYPPYVRLITVTVRDKYEGRMWNVGRDIADALRSCGIADWAGPVIPAVDRVNNEYLSQFWIKLPRDRKLATTKSRLKAALDAIELKYKNGPTIVADVDPY